ncbi:transposase, partial [Staphylococcus aureus]|uniref:transposase n=1 Tax=Staphylococcus aureus TaxID=1280 RepID=UPI00301D889E
LPRKIFAKHAIKCLDRLLGNPHLHRERRLFYTEITRLLLGTTPHPVILVDWSPIDERGRHFLLRAAIPFGQRAFPVYERVHHKEGCPVCQRALLDDLSEILPGSVTPILITDAGFKTPWLRAVTRHGWYYVGRVRGAMQVQLPDARRWQPL